ncbi:transposase-like protein, IS1239 [Streptococcus pneumoniae]|nr:transposase-like protein, IS1239 [Streptococcus pneumoniae]
MIGKNIKSLRKTHDLTQPEFARIVGISRNSLKVAFIENWINNYPKKCLDYKSPSEFLLGG